MAARSRSKQTLFVAALLALLAAAAEAQYIPYFGKNKVKYDDFAWRVYKSPHFEIYYYPEFEQHLARLSSYAESAYQKISAELKHEMSSPIPLILYKTHSEFEQTNLYPDFVPEGALAFTEPVRGRMVVPIDEPPDLLQGLITHELTHAFEFDMIPRSLIQRTIPLWVDEGLAEYLRGIWDPLDTAMLRDAAVTDRVPRLTRADQDPELSSGRVPYNFGHAGFEFIEARFGKEGIRQFLYTLRKSVAGGGVDDIFQQAFRMRPDEFDQAYEKWLKEKFKPFRDRQRPSDYGTDLSPNSERTPFTQVFAFAPSPSGEMIAAITGNRSDGEVDVVLLSASDGSVIRNLTKGYTNAWEGIELNLSARAFGRSIAFDPRGDALAFFARVGKRRSLILLSVLNGQTLKKIPIQQDEARSPCLLPDGRHAVFSALKEGVSDLFLLDMETGETKNLTQDDFYDSDPWASPDGSLIVYSRRVSGFEKLYAFPLADPTRKTQLSFGTHNDVTPSFSPNGERVYYVSDEDDDIFNLRSLDLKSGVVRQYTDALGGDLMPAVLRGKGPERTAFVAFFKGEYRLHSVESTDPLKEVDQDVRATNEEIVDFQPDVVHQVVAENKRKKRLFEKLFLEGRPPLNLAVTSSGDFFGGSQIAMSDVLGDQNLLFTASSFREFRTYQGVYANLAKRLHWGITGFDTTIFSYPTYYIPQNYYSRDGSLFTQRSTGGSAFVQYPLDKFRRLEFGLGFVKISQQYENPFVEEVVREQLAAQGQSLYLYNGSFLPVSVNLVQETTRFREFGPLSGSTFSIGLQASPGVQGLASRFTVEADFRKYIRLGGSAVFAARARGFHSNGDQPDYFAFGGNMELRGYQYYSFQGNQGFFANLEFRFPIIDLMATPLGVLGPVRGTLFAGMGGAKYRGQPYKFWTNDPDVSYVNDPIFGEPVTGLHLVDGRASYGIGLQFFFLGYPMHFDWVKLTDLKVVSKDTRFEFWIGFDF
jgi:hypothetical protein